MTVEYDRELYRLKADLCKSFADPTRLSIINELRDGEKLVGQLVEALNIAQSAVSRHLALLRERGVVTFRREGTSVYYRLSDPKIEEACDILHRILMDQIARNRSLAGWLSP